MDFYTSINILFRMAEETVSVDIPKSVADKIEEKRKGSEFGSLSEYVGYVLREVVSEEDEEEVFSEEDEERVKERLKALGYLD